MDGMLVLAGSKRQQDSTEIARVNSVKDSLNAGWKVANETVKKLAKRKPFGLGLMAGFGAGKSGVSPIIGVGVSYSFARF
jgi:hypothetical protein